MFGFRFLFWSFRFFLESYGKSDPVNRNMASYTQVVKTNFYGHQKLSVIRQKDESKHERTCAYQGVRNVHFSENLFCFLETPVLRFVLLPYYRQNGCLTTLCNTSLEMVKLIQNFLQYSNYVVKAFTCSKSTMETPN